MMRSLVLILLMVLAGCAQIDEGSPGNPANAAAEEAPSTHETVESTSEAFVSAGTGDLEVRRRMVRLLDAHPPNLSGVIIEIETMVPTSSATELRLEAWNEDGAIAESSQEGPSSFVILVEPESYDRGELLLLIAPSSDGPSAQAIPELRIQTTVFQNGAPDWEYRAP